ncbi:MAG: hypothetical protein DMG89_06805 [Acidobacteria bacterium]|nr:MAG: hypothetical protein DMG89_06805 [Acidobacteriota bacterium]
MTPQTAWSQVQVVNYHNDVARTGTNPNETILTPARVNKAGFGLLFSQNIDGFAVGQPLYLSNVSIPGKGTHNVVYVTTLHDSVYAFDADSNTGNNAVLWHVNFTNPAAGITTASGTFLPCQDVTKYSEEGIVSTPVIDAITRTLYVVAKTNENGVVVHRLHALDVATGAEKFGEPVQITGSFTARSGTTVNFNSLHALNRPAVLLNNGLIYIAFGSNGCNDSSHGWLFAYDATTLQRVSVFNTAPEGGLGSIWQTAGPAADPEGNIYVSTGEANFNANSGGQDFGSSVLKLAQAGGTLDVSDYFTPHDQALLSQMDLDLSSCGIVVLPDQAGSHPHLAVTSGKQGIIYLLDRDNMGQFDPFGDTQIVQEIAAAIGPMFSTPAYWNGRVYFNGNAHPVKAFALSNGKLITTPVATSVKLSGAHAPMISANGNSNGIVWNIAGTVLWALDAMTLTTLYNTSQAGTRDTLPPMAHFATPMIANGRVYVGTQTGLVAYGLLPELAISSGNNQSTTVFTALPFPLSVVARDRYTGQPRSGVPVTFSDNGKGGTFSSPVVITDSSGTATTAYTFSKIARTVQITASSPLFLSGVFTEKGTPGPPKWLVAYSGNNQSAPVNTALPAAIVAKVADQYSNGVPGIPVSFSDGGAGGSFSATTVITDSLGRARVNYTTPTKSGVITITAASAGLHSPQFTETATAGAAAITVVSGNNQTAPPSSQPQALTVKATDRYANPVQNITVTYSDGGAGGSFFVNPVTTDSSGVGGSFYTTPPSSGVLRIYATENGVAASAVFTVTVP